MTEEIAPFGWLRPDGALLTAPMKVHKENGRVILLQKTRLWFRAAVCFWAMVVLLTPFMIYSEWFGSQTTQFTCDRGTGVCEVDGRTKDTPPLADIKSAQIDHASNRRDGPNYGINLVTRDGKKYPIEQQRAIKDSVVADYRATVKTINAFLANPGQQKLDVSFTYVAGLQEKLQSIFYFFFGIGTLAAGLGLWTTRRYIFEREKITLMVGGPLRKRKQEFAGARISAVVDHVVVNERRIEVRVDGDHNIPVASAGPYTASLLDPIPMDLAEHLGKPIERVTG
jgi:hypothetical protein